MSTLLIIGLKNAILIIPLALMAMAIGRWARRPALSHLLWTLVLVKLLTPPLVHVPVGWQVDVASWVRSEAPAGSASGTPGSGLASRAVTSERNSVSKRSANRSHLTSHTRSFAGHSAGAKQNAVNAGWSGWLNWAHPANWGALLNWSSLWSFKIQLLAAVWLAGSLYVLSKVLWRSYEFHRFLQLVERRHEHLGPRAAELAVRARITIAPRVIVVDSVVSPMLWGMGRRACLVFPAKLVSRLSPAELDALLLHELAHFARGDHWVRVLELVSSVVYWWHPVFWWARHELEIAEEQCCDAWVIEHQSGSRISYAEALLATIDFLHEPATSRPPAACGLGEVPFLRTRLTQIMRGQVAARLPRTVTALLVLGGILCSPLEPVVWAKTANGSLHSATHRRLPDRLSTPSGLNQAIARVDAERVQNLLLTTPPGPPTPTAASSSTNRRALPPMASRQLAPVWALAIAPDGKHRLEARVGGRTTLLTMRLDLTAHQITCVSFAPHGSQFASGHEDATVRRWDSDTGGVLQAYKGCDAPITSVQFSPDGSQLAAGTNTGSVVVWDVTTGDELQRLELGKIAVSCVRWSPRGDRLAVSAGAWSEQSRARLIVWSPARDVTDYDQPLPRPAGALAWMDGGETVIVAGWNGFAHVLNLGTDQIISELQVDKDAVSAAGWSADCPLLVQPARIDTLFGVGR